ncbi:Tetratricopeptide-like helical domain superfamily [Sesbania bispinosa]|nr:Tetratricopeptide-like helical domain superfamily [Sesbania bispinosa]
MAYGGAAAVGVRDQEHRRRGWGPRGPGRVRTWVGEAKFLGRVTEQQEHHSFNSLTLISLSHSFSLRFTHSLYSTPSSPSDPDCCDYLRQFLPFGTSNFKPLSIINPRERRILVLGLSNIIKNEQGFVLKGFSLRFCPFFLVKIMKLLETRDAAFAFFKLAFGNNHDTEEIARLCCIAAHVLAAQNLQLLAQDVVSWVFARIGASRSKELVEFMWRNHPEYESDFSVLNTLMRGFLNVGMSLEALEVLHRMRVVGVRPGITAITILVRLLLRIGDYGSVWKIFKDMLRKGPRPSNITFNAMIYGFCRQQGLVIGESLLHLMTKFQCNPDVFTYNIIINAYCIVGKTSVAIDWLHLMMKSGCEPSIATFNTIMHALCREGNVIEGRKLFDGIQNMGITPNTAICNTLMDGYVKAREVGQASMLYEEMRTKGISPDLSWLCWAGRLDEAMELLQDLLEKGLTLSVVAFNSLIGAYSKAGLEDKAFETYHIMVKCGFTPSSSTCNSLLLGLCRKGRLQEARKLLYRMSEKGFPINKVAYTVLFDGYFKMNDLDGAQFLWKEMKERGIYPDAVAFTALIDGLSKAGNVEEAYEVFLEMSAIGFVPNNFTYNSLIGGLCNCGKMTEALKLEKEMRLKGLFPDTFTFNIIIDGFCRQRNMKSAVDVFLDMHRIGLMPDVSTFNILVDGYCKAFDMIGADEIVNKMYTCGFDPDITTYNIRIHGYLRIRKMNRAVIILNQLVSAGIVPNTVTYNTMMSGICSDILDHAMILAAKLLKMGFIPNVITTNILLSHFCKQGIPERALLWGQKLREICFGFDEISYRILEKAYHLVQDDVELDNSGCPLEGWRGSMNCLRLRPQECYQSEMWLNLLKSRNEECFYVLLRLYGMLGGFKID